jgi:hypothetical protein
MDWSAERVGYVDHAGATQWAMLGPKAGWPAWAIVPDGTKLKVRANFEAAPGRNATGFGELAGTNSARLVADRYQAALRTAGWTIRVGRYDARLPDEDIHWCIIDGRRYGRVQRLRVNIDETKTVGQLSWTDGPLPYPIGLKDEACWS